MDESVMAFCHGRSRNKQEEHCYEDRSKKRTHEVLRMFVGIEVGYDGETDASSVFFVEGRKRRRYTIPMIKRKVDVIAEPMQYWHHA